jgi:hypothetical protein
VVTQCFGVKLKMFVFSDALFWRKSNAERT